MTGIPEYGTGRHEDYLTRQDEERAAISAPAREFTAWADARCIERGDLYGWATMADAFAAGMQAQRNLDAAPEPKPAPEVIGARTALAEDVHDLIDGYCPDIPMCRKCQAREGEVLVLADTYAVAAGQASVTMAEQVRLAREDRDVLRKAVLSLAAEYGDATGDDEVEGHVTGSLYMALRAEVLNAAAARLRKVAEPPS